ncbi:MAG TPA: penicillin-binding protein 2 [Pyrinomonadaceae bacterium]|nr:penicillin-binding protein 2 [Pyrinomonadaceae bacterium]
MPLRARQKKGNLKQTAFTRFMLIIAVFVLWIGGISARLVHLQVKQSDWLRERAIAVRTGVWNSRQLRGTIYDRTGRQLAVSVSVKTLFVDATAITDVKATAKKLSEVLALNTAKLTQQLADAKAEGRKFVPLAKGLDSEKVEEINEKLEVPKIAKADTPKFEAVHWREEQTRVYPYKDLAAHVIGFSDLDGNGQAGIEQSKNDELYGEVVKKVQERTRLGEVYDEHVTEAKEPKDVVLTLSVPIQVATEDALQAGVKRTGAKSGMVVVIDNKTGDILALANYPTFDPGNLGSITSENLRDGAIQSIYSPGSVFKLVTYGSALDKGLITPEGMIDSGNGTIEVAKHKFTDSHSIGRVTYKKALAHSSNVCAIKTSMRVGKESFYSYVQKFGFGKPTGIELPAETGGIVRPVERWNGDSLASMSIGYEIGVSALQMATAFATIANDGVRIQPRIIKEIRQSDETTVPLPEPERTRIVSAETARSLRTMLREVVLDGTGKRAKLDGYSSAGKTGTAWKFDPAIKAINRAKYVSSFIGFAPADNPAVTIAVVMDEPKLGGRDGGGSAAPIFQEIAQKILPELNIAPDMESTAPVAEADEEDIPETPGVDDAKPFDTPATGGPKLSDRDERPAAAMPGKNGSGKPDERLIKPNPKTKASESPTREREKLAEPGKGQIKNKSSTGKVELRT